MAAGLPPVNFPLVNAPALGGLAFTSEYDVGLTVAPDPAVPRSGLVLRTVAVAEWDPGALGYQALVGRDVLGHALLVYDGPGRRAVLGYGPRLHPPFARAGWTVAPGTLG